MKNKEIRNKILELLSDRLKMFGVKDGEIKGDFDLVKSGLMDSMAFVNFIGEMEKAFDIEIDFDTVLEDDDFTSVNKIIELFANG